MDKRGGGVSRFSIENFLSHSAENFRRGGGGSFSVSLISGIEKVWIRGGGIITIFRRSSCFTVPKYFIGEQFGVSDKFFYRKFSCIGGGGGGGAARFCRNFLSHRTETKSFVKEPFCFPEIFWYRKKFMDKRGHITIFSRNFYVSQCRKISWASLQCLRNFGVSKNFMHTRGYHVFPSKIFALTVPKNLWIIGGITSFRR